MIPSGTPSMPRLRIGCRPFGGASLFGGVQHNHYLLRASAPVIARGYVRQQDQFVYELSAKTALLASLSGISTPFSLLARRCGHSSGYVKNTGVRADSIVA